MDIKEQYVLLECGHWFKESGESLPDSIIRACSDIHTHYGRQYKVVKYFRPDIQGL